MRRMSLKNGTQQCGDTTTVSNTPKESTQSAREPDPSTAAKESALQKQIKDSKQKSVEGREVLAQIAEIEEPINTAQQVVGGNVIVEVEGIKQPVLIAAVLTHHPDALPKLACC